MGKVKLSKVFFGAQMTGYTGADRLNEVGRRGVLALYEYVDAADECLLVFYFDQGWDIGWLRHSHSRYSLADGVLTATSLHSGTVKEYDVSKAVEMGADVFQVGNPAVRDVPVEWVELFVNIYGNFSWWDDPTLETT